MPAYLYAAEAFTLRTIANTFSSVIVNSVLMLAIAIAGAAFSYGIAVYIAGARNGDPNVIKKGNTFLMWGGITIFIILSFYGIITFVQRTTGLGGDIIIPDASLRATKSFFLGDLSAESSLGNGPRTIGAVIGGSDAASSASNGGKTVSSTPDPDKSQWDGGNKPCPQGSAFNDQGVCVEIQSAATELAEISTASDDRPANDDTAPLPDFKDLITIANLKGPHFIYAVQNGKLVSLISNTTDSKDEKLNKTIWDFFVKTNPPETVNKVTSFHVFPTSPKGMPETYGFVSPSPNGIMLAVTIDMHMKGGQLDTSELYDTLLHEGAHIISMTDLGPARATDGTCPTYKALSFTKCVASTGHLMKFIGKFWVTNGRGTYISGTFATKAFVSDYAKSQPSEDFAETYSKFIVQDKPSGNDIADQKILFMYDIPEFVAQRAVVRRNITNEVAERGQDSDGDGLVDTVEEHRGMDPQDSDTDNDGVPDAQDVDGDGDGSRDSAEIDNNGDGVLDGASSGDDGYQTSSTFNADTNGDGSVNIYDDSQSAAYDPTQDSGMYCISGKGLGESSWSCRPSDGSSRTDRWMCSQKFGETSKTCVRQ